MKQHISVIVLPGYYGSANRSIIGALTKLAHEHGIFCCHTSTENPNLDTLEERHLMRINEALDAGKVVYAVNPASNLVELGVRPIGGMLGEKTIRQLEEICGVHAETVSA